jgi:hypothetical protein
MKPRLGAIPHAKEETVKTSTENRSGPSWTSFDKQMFGQCKAFRVERLEAGFGFVGAEWKAQAQYAFAGSLLVQVAHSRHQQVME